ncbi:hypothetical protein LNV23_19130 [Paucibacter sp. DJ1R-11]|uniref:hypothetical protein n=1 Tax=Paucibacter sp. DJ1R-11 TaxID=2893556 RepID=UPI0021E3E76E|nr:hypothetical protein [Paucibacter sp. DJ1R-11]MCV2365568.1 hypothetical protein [Paucibacter sp. DJ1R-11]
MSADQLVHQAGRDAYVSQWAYQAGWDACMSQWADHMTRMNAAISSPLLAHDLPAQASATVPTLPTVDMIEAICAIHAAHESKPWPDGYSDMAQGVRRRLARDGYLAALAVAMGNTTGQTS